MALRLKQRDGLTVERDEGPAAEPGAFMGDNAVGEIAAAVERRQPGLGGATISGNIGRGEQTADGIGDGRGRQAVAAVRTQTSSHSAVDGIATNSACASLAWARGLCIGLSSVSARTRMFVSAVIFTASQPSRRR